MKKLLICLVIGVVLSGMIIYAYFTRAEADEAVLVPPVASTPTQTNSQQVATVLDSVSKFGELRKSTFNSGSVLVSYYLADDVGMGQTVDAIKFDCFSAQKAIWQSVKQINEVSISIHGPLVDQYGHQSDGNIGLCSLKMDTEARFDWSGLDQDSAWKVYDNVWLLPNLTTS